MERAEAASHLDVRPVGDPDEGMTKRHVYSLSVAPYYGDLVIEYKPDNWILDERGLDELGDAGFFRDASWEGERPERVVAELYHVLVAVLYERHAYLDDPWNRLPLVVEYRYKHTGKGSDGEEYTATLGRFA